MDDIFPPSFPYLASSEDVEAAATLIASYGDDAGLQAAARADRSRSVGNHLHFCRWRQVERLIRMLAADCATGTVH